MASMVVFGLFMALIFGGMMLALVMGYLSTEEKRAQEERANRAAERVAEIPRFFAELGDAPVPVVPPSPHDRIVLQFEDYVRTEQALVARFLREPSIDNLYRQASASPMLQ